MRVRAALTAVLIGAFAVTETGASFGVATASGTASAGRTETVTVRGLLERLVVDTTDGEVIRYMVRGSEGAWWLDGLSEPAPAAGSHVEVTGIPRDESTLAVDTIRVTAPSGEVSAKETSAAARRTTRVLVLRAYWGARPPARPTTATTKQRVISNSRAWFSEVSHGRYTVSGAVTPWLKVDRPFDCYGGSGGVGNQALAAAQRRGFRLSSYTRFILYLPCSAGGILGYASLPGQHVVLFNNMDRNVVVHEQGHNLGLEHASSRTCRSPRWGAMTWSSRCQVSEYGDEIDAMGNRRAGHYNAYYKSRLGWLQRATTVTSTRTVTLARHETTGPGLKAVRVRAGGATYWLEYRTRTGADRGLRPGTEGVQIRHQSGDRTQLLDAGPGSTIGFYDFADDHLPVGSSWTSPQNVRITVSRQTPSAATVAIRFRAGAPRPPSAPTSVRTQALLNAARITWTRPADNGAIIRQYKVTRSDGATRVVTTFAGQRTTYTWSGLSPSRTFWFKVQAINHVGASPAARSPVVRPLTDTPSVVINSPGNGATVAGVVPISVTATPNASTRSPIYDVELSVDNVWMDTDDAPPWGPFQWDTRGLPDGSHTFRVTVQDRAGRTSSASRTVTVNNPTPTVTIDSPGAGATVSGNVGVGYSLSPPSWDWQSVDLLIDGSPWMSAGPGEALSFDAAAIGPGSHTLRIRATSGFGEYQSPPVSVSVPTPTVTIDSPGAGDTLSGQVSVTYSLAPTDWTWSWIELLVDDVSWASAAPGEPLFLDTTSFAPESYTLRVRAFDDQSTGYDSPEVTVTITNP